MAAEQLGRKPARATSAPLAPGALVSAATEAARSGAPWIETPVAYDGILLASFGGPEGQEDVLPFLRNVTAGRGIPDERLEEVAVHYRENGGISPINEQNRMLKTALEEELAARGIDLPVFWGNRNWAPYLNDALTAAHEAGATKLIAIATSAYASYSSCRQYREDFADALEDTGLQGVVEIDKVRPFFDHPGFVDPFVDGLVAALDSLRDEDAELGLADIEVLFTTHSVPTADATLSGPAEETVAGIAPQLAREHSTDGAYADQHFAVSEAIVARAMDRLRGRCGVGMAGDDVARFHWQLVYQSRSGPAHQPWLEPDINDVIAELPAAGRRAVVVVPIGFISDHMEVKWDLDTEAVETATEAGLRIRRTPTPGIHPSFVSALVDLVVERRDGIARDQRPACTPLGPWFDVCRAGCCAPSRGELRPAIAGLLP